MLNETQLQDSVEYLMNYIVENDKYINPKYSIGDEFTLYEMEWVDNRQTGERESLYTRSEGEIRHIQAYYNKRNKEVDFIYTVSIKPFVDAWMLNNAYPLTTEELERRMKLDPEHQLYCVVPDLWGFKHVECDKDGNILGKEHKQWIKSK